MFNKRDVLGGAILVLIVGVVVFAVIASNRQPNESKALAANQQPTPYPPGVIAIGNLNNPPVSYILPLYNVADLPPEVEEYEEDTEVYFFSIDEVQRKDIGSQGIGMCHKVGILESMANAFPTSVDYMIQIRDDNVARDACLAQNNYVPVCAIRFWKIEQINWQEVADGIIVKCMCKGGSRECNPNFIDGYLVEKWKLPKGASGNPQLLERTFRLVFPTFGGPTGTINKGAGNQ